MRIHKLLENWIFGFVIALFVFLGCQTVTKVSLNPQNEGVSPSSLSWVAAQKRARVISQVHYHLNLQIPSDKQFYTGEVVIQFLYKPSVEPLRIDFREGEVRNLVINSKTLKPNYNHSYILVDSGDLKSGPNQIEIQFEQKYSQSGAGLHRFSDPEDQSVYLWTQLEPFSANLFFPCFDQPNIKAIYSMRVTAPSGWKVISTMASPMPKEIDKNWKLWDFPDSPTMSTYLFTLFAGPYKEWRSQAGKVPLRLFARKSLSKYVDEKEWFDLTKGGLKFFPDYFNTPYPFSKLDQIIVPEASFGAMENLAAISYSEEFISRGKKTQKEKEGLAVTLIHELAHMWFGDLVTMEWWNDLWLNESFATYLEALATSRVTGSASPWFEFYANTKRAAYYEDQMITTHPMEGIVNSTDDTMAAFDAITYGKGAAVFKQLSYFIGEQKFRKGLEIYFKNFAYKNATLKDFMNSLSQGANTDLIPWSDSWLKTSGVDELNTIFTCKDGNLKDLDFQVTSQKKGPPRSHSFEVALIHDQHKKLQVYHSLPVRTDASGVVKLQLQNIKCPDAVFANYQDHAYLKVNFDSKSLQTLSTNLSSIEDPLIRLMTWSSLWQMVRDQKIELQRYVSIVKKHFKKETNSDILIRVGSTISGGPENQTNSVVYFWPRSTNAQASARLEFVSEMESLFWSKLKSSPMGSDIQKIWFHLFLQMARSPDFLQKLNSLVSVRGFLPGLNLDMDQKWRVLASLCQSDFPTKEVLLSKLSKEDRSERGQLGKLACEVLTPQAENKIKWYRAIKSKESTFSHTMLSEVLRNLVPQEQIQFQSLYRDDFFEFLKNQSLGRDEFFNLRFAYFLVPKNCTESSASKLRSFAEQEKQLLPAVKIELLKSSEEEMRCVKIRERAVFSE